MGEVRVQKECGRCSCLCSSSFATIHFLESEGCIQIDGHHSTRASIIEESSCGASRSSRRKDYGAIYNRDSVATLQSQAASTARHPNEWHQFLHLVPIAINVQQQTPIHCQVSSELCDK